MALLNLAVNAYDAMPVGGLLTLSAHNNVVDVEHPAALTPGDYVRVTVTDTGTGMDEAILARVKEPFFTTKRPGVGTRAELWLPPAYSSATPVEVLPPKKTGTSATPSWVVLLVDDDWLVATSTQRILEDLGHKAVVASSAAGALEVLQSGLAVDLLITDQAMPEMTRLELIGRVREAWPQIPVLLTTGYAELPGGLQNVPRLLKPYRQADLAAWIEQLLGSARPGAAETNVVPLRLH